MSDEYMDDPESPEEQPQAMGFDSLPPETQAEIRKLRKENQGLRQDRGTVQKELLTAKYGDEVVELIPPEVTDYARQTELAEKLMARLASSSTESQAPVAPEEAVEEPPTPAEQQLATATGGPATGTSPPAADISNAEILRIGKTDPAEAARLVKAKMGQ